MSIRSICEAVPALCPGLIAYVAGLFLICGVFENNARAYWRWREQVEALFSFGLGFENRDWAPQSKRAARLPPISVRRLSTSG